jgi:ubiquinone/menaquinone biosynthesis C-methylase UbiE
MQQCPQESFDVAVATQVLEYVKDVPGALTAMARVLRPGGRVLVLDTDWDSIVWHSSDEERMARVLAAWEQHPVDPHLPRRLRGWLERAGLQVARSRLCRFATSASTRPPTARGCSTSWSASSSAATG